MAVESRAVASCQAWRWLPCCAVGILLVLLYGGALLRGDSPAQWWKAWGVPAMEPAFFDASVIGAWFELRAAGEDPSTNNPLDSLERTLNYPPTIFVFSALGWTRATTPVVGAILAIVYVGCVFLLTAGVSRNEAVYWSLLVCAPAGLLAVERGNLDVLILGLVVCAVRMVHRPWIAAAALGLAALWKLFAIAGLGALLAGGRSQRIAGGVVLAVCIGAFWFLRDSIATTVGSISHESTIAFGVNAVANFWIANGDPLGWGMYLRAAALPFAIVVALAAVLAGFVQQMRIPGAAASGQAVFGAWVGALLFGVLFLSGTQFDYKLLFLWPMVPWVWNLALAVDHPAQRRAAVAWLAALLIVSGWLFFSSDTSWRLFALKQGFAWLLFLLTAFFGGSLLGREFQKKAPSVRFT